jgi:hypothetical protein
MTWRPLDKVPDPIQLAFLDAVRATVAPVGVYTGVSRANDDMLAVDLKDGRRVFVAFTKGAPAPATFGPRQALRFDLDGRAVVGSEGFGLAARAVIDVKTQAFVEVSCEVLWRRREERPQ